MYSVVLLAALATTTSAPNWHRGCYSGCQGSCYGCYGGCYGAWTFGGYGFAGGGHGYHGGCYGAYGAFAGDPYIGSYYGGCTGCYGCYGGHSCYGIPVPALTNGNLSSVHPMRDSYAPINPPPGVTGEKPPEEVPAPKEKKKETDEKKKLSLDPNAPIRAKVSIAVPVHAKLFVDDRHINVAAGTRVFQTPPLAPGERYFYDIRIEIGQASDQRRVVIEAGQEVAVSFPSLRSGTATAQANR